jgi:PPOX class probable F420-dependent enzyme
MSDPIPSRKLVGDAILGDPLVRELLSARLVCVLATLERDVTIHAVPMWFVWTERAIVLATGSRSRKLRNLEADRRATLVVHDSRPGFEVCGVTMAGEVEIVRGSEARPLVDLVHGRYVAAGKELPEEIQEFLDSDDVALCFRPLSAATWDERSSAASTALRAAGAALPLEPTSPRP